MIGFFLLALILGLAYTCLRKKESIDLDLYFP
jgi:hypothetical protein